MPAWLNFIGYQVAWLVAVASAGQGRWWPGVLACALFAACVVMRSDDRVAELRVLPYALATGLLLDGTLAASGWLHYAAGQPGIPASPWILALWMAFAMTLRHSLRWLGAHAWLALVVGALGGPLAYWGAARGFSAVEFARPTQATAALAAGWAVAMPLLAWLARDRASPRLAASGAGP